jgi:hypothetical protein
MDLDRQVAEALGERVCGGSWRIVWGEDHEERARVVRGFRCEKCGAPKPQGEGLEPGERHGGEIPPYSTSWEAAGRLCDTLRLEHGWHIDITANRYGVRVRMIRRVAERAQEATAEALTFPEALSLAALRALGERGEG